jgi:hypothetical protein
MTQSPFEPYTQQRYTVWKHIIERCRQSSEVPITQVAYGARMSFPDTPPVSDLLGRQVS